MGKRVAFEGVGVVGVRGVVVGQLMVLRGGEDISGGRDAEVGANVAEDDGVEHDVFVGSTGEGNLWDGKCDTLGKRRYVASAEGGLELVWARAMA